MLILDYIRLRSEQPYDIVNKLRLISAKLNTPWTSYTVMQRQLNTLYCAKGGFEIIRENPPTNPLKNHNMKSWTPPFTGGQGTTSIRTSFCVRLSICQTCVFLCPPQSCKNASMVPQVQFLVPTWFLKICGKFRQKALSNWLINSLYICFLLKITDRLSSKFFI